MKCRHERVFPRLWDGSYDGDGDNWIVLLGDIKDADARVCAACREWLPLGKANDGGEHASAVAVELRAAELAADMSIGVGVGGHRPEHIDGEHCWHVMDDDDDMDCCFCRRPYLSLFCEHELDVCDTGYLARCIATHPEQP